MPIDFACPSCQKKYRVKDELAGKHAKCSKCSTRIKIPVPVPAPAADELDLESDLSNWFDEELSNTSIPAVRNTPMQSVSGKRCTACGAQLGENAVLCVACGYDLRKGKKLKTEKIVEQPPSQVSKKAKQAASLMRGTVFSAIGALIGAAIWGVVVVLTDREIGYIAWGLGFLAGAGMAMGHDDDDGTLAGMIAAGMALMGIGVAKFFVFQHLKSILAEEGIDLGAFASEVGAGFTFLMLFGIFDLLFIFFALGTAYKVGSGKATD